MFLKALKLTRRKVLMECIKTLWVAAELPLFWAGMLGSSGYYVVPSILPLLLWNSTNKAVVSWLVFCTYIMIHDNKHFFGEHFKFRAKYSLKEICHKIGELDLSRVVFSILLKGWWPFLHLDLLISRTWICWSAELKKSKLKLCELVTALPGCLHTL